MIIGWDPGKSGGACALSESGQILSIDAMPTNEVGVCAVGVAALYRKYLALADFDEPVNVFIEKIFTKPTDAISYSVIKTMGPLVKSVEAYLASIDGDFTAAEHLDALRACFEGLNANLKGQDLSKIRPDGRVGMLNYAKGAGILQMAAWLGWPITEVMPRTWMKVIKDGAPGHLKPKEQSFYVARSLWPAHMEDATDGQAEAALIAEYGRRTLSRKTA
jgi:hypothetical protein